MINSPVSVAVADAKDLAAIGASNAEWIIACSAYPAVARHTALMIRLVSYLTARGLSMDGSHVVANVINTELGPDLEIIPRIEAYRLIAHNSGDFLGGKVTEYGPTKEFTVGQQNQKVVAPEYIEYTVRRLVNGHAAEWTARESFLENVPTGDGLFGFSDFWLKRPTGQLTIRAEAQALRRAFQAIDHYTAEELNVRTTESCISGNRIANGKLSGGTGYVGLGNGPEIESEASQEDVAGEVVPALDVERVIAELNQCESVDQARSLVSRLPVGMPHTTMNMIITAFKEFEQSLTKTATM